MTLDKPDVSAKPILINDISWIELKADPLISSGLRKNSAKPFAPKSVLRASPPVQNCTAIRLMQDQYRVPPRLITLSTRKNGMLLRVRFMDFQSWWLTCVRSAICQGHCSSNEIRIAVAKPPDSLIVPSSRCRNSAEVRAAVAQDFKFGVHRHPTE